MQTIAQIPLPEQPKNPRYTGRVKGGYPAAPGTGPKGERCNTCKHCLVIGRKKNYYKCGVIRWTHGAATDIKARSPACNLWEAEK